MHLQKSMDKNDWVARVAQLARAPSKNDWSAVKPTRLWSFRKNSRDRQKSIYELLLEIVGLINSKWLFAYRNVLFASLDHLSYTSQSTNRSNDPKGPEGHPGRQKWQQPDKIGLATVNPGGATAPNSHPTHCLSVIHHWSLRLNNKVIQVLI